MKLIEQSVELLPELGRNEEIERAARLCYKSESKDYVTSNQFVQKLIKAQHYAMLEHGAVYLKLPVQLLPNVEHNPYLRYYIIGNCVYVTATKRLFVEASPDNISYLKPFICSREDNHDRRLSFKIITDRAIATELLRHRKFSFAMESQRYCNYSKEKFGQEITFIIPYKVKQLMAEISQTKDLITNQDNSVLKDLTLQEAVEALTLKDDSVRAWYNAAEKCEKTYLSLLDNGWKPQEARAVLPNCTKTELIISCFKSDLSHFFQLRLFETTGKVQPAMKELAEKMFKLFAKTYEEIFNKK